jgi:thioredoxin-like negative regulator of GroEL
MNNDQEILNSLLERLGQPGAAPLTADELQWIEDFRQRYPFFAIPSAIAAKDGEPSLQETVTAPSPDALARLRGNAEASRFDNFYPADKAPATPTTNSAIDDFLSTYGHRTSEEDQLLERLIFNPVPDYAQQLASEEASSLPTAESAAADDNSQDSLINRFILSHHSTPDQTPVATEKPAKPEKKSQTQPADGLLSVSLAKIYIKTHRYEQAYEILNGLSLRFPEKSSYFADQLRFLQKLIRNEQARKVEQTIEK